MPIIKNVSDLKRELERRVKIALEQTQNEIYDVVQRQIQKYYDEYEPKRYIRLEYFLNSLIKTEIISSGNSFSCKVQIDDNYLDYRYPKKSEKGGIPPTGRDVATWANAGIHGGYIEIKETFFWDDALKELGGKQGIYDLMKKNLKASGIPIK